MEPRLVITSKPSAAVTYRYFIGIWPPAVDVRARDALVMPSSPSGDGTQRCGVLLEPVCRRQTLLPECVSVCLTALLQDWDDSSLTGTTSESWVLHSPGTSAPGAEAFQDLLLELCAHCVHVVRHTITQYRAQIKGFIRHHETTVPLYTLLP